MVNQTIQIFARLKPTKGKKGVSMITCCLRCSVYCGPRLHRSWILHTYQYTAQE